VDQEERQRLEIIKCLFIPSDFPADFKAQASALLELCDCKRKL
jgi:hypothetical protein